MMKRFYVALFLFAMAACSGKEARREFLIHNSADEAVYVQVDGYKQGKKLVFIQHGLASDMGHSAVQTAKKAFLDKGWQVVSFDSRHSLGKSDGDVVKGRLSTFEEDLKTVIDWAKKQNFYSAPFALAGHSLGGASVLKYAAENPDSVEAVIPVAPVVSGKKWEESCMTYMADFCRNWKKRGFYNYKTVVIPYAVVEEAQNYDAFLFSEAIKAKVLLIAVKDDRVIACRDIEELYSVLKTEKSLGIVSDGGHNFQTGQSRRKLYDLIAAFL